MTPQIAQRRKTCDKKSLAVAYAALKHALPAGELVILFGSRARGDYHPRHSDLDLLLITAEIPAGETEIQLHKAIQVAADAAYDSYVHIDLHCMTKEEFIAERRYVNSLASNAMQEGIPFPRNPATYLRSDYEDERKDTQYSWLRYELSRRNAEIKLEILKDQGQRRSPDWIQGETAQRTLVAAARAVSHAHQATPRKNKSLAEMLALLREIDPELATYSLGIPAAVYDDYELDLRPDRPRQTPKLKSFPDYARKTEQDLRFLLQRAEKVQRQNAAAETRDSPPLTPGEN